MFDDENPWSGWLGSGGFAHPDSPCAGGGSRCRHRHSSLGLGGVSPWSPVGHHTSAQEAAAGYALFELERTLDRLRECRSPANLDWIALDAFGMGSYGGRFCDALRQGDLSRKLLPLQKTMIGAELHDYLQGGLRSKWNALPKLHSRQPRLKDVGYYLRTSDLWSLRGREALKRMAETRDTLLKELGQLFSQPTPIFAEARAKLDPRTLEYWQQHNDLAKTRLSRGDAGWYLGKVCENVFTALAELLRRGDFHARISAAAPLLTQYGLDLRDAAAPTVGIASNATAWVTAPAADPRASIPYHNDDALTPKVEQDTFKTLRGVDMNNLSPEENNARRALMKQGRSDRTAQRQLLSSADSFETIPAKKGEKLYGFTTHGYPKGQQSMYWLTEADYADVKAQHCKDGVWDREGVKNYLALPCFNRANSIVECEVLDDHTVVRSHIGAATERISYSNDTFSSGMYTKTMPGGGFQLTPAASKVSPERII